jgi:translation initiation factor 4G
LACVADLIARTVDGEATKSAITKALVDYVVDASNVKIAQSIGVLLAALYQRAAFETSTLEAAIGDLVSSLDDVAIDVPMAPRLLASVVAAVVAARAVALDFITAAGSGIEDVTLRRQFAADALCELNAQGFINSDSASALDLQSFAKGSIDDETVNEWLLGLGLSHLA